MTETLRAWDEALFLWLNGLHRPYLDDAMIFASATHAWIPLYVLIGVGIASRYKRNAWQYLLLIALIILCSDQFSSALVKPLVGRLRPCHQPELQGQIFVPAGCGGMYGFISSHAANTFALAYFVGFLFKQQRYGKLLRAGMYIWASAVSYSRIYLGVHYPADVLFGALAGAGISAWWLYAAMRFRLIPVIAS